MIIDKPDYKKYTYFQLLDCLEQVDRELYPDRFQEILTEIQYIQSRFPSVKYPKLYSEEDKENPISSFFKKLLGVDNKKIKTYGSIEAALCSSICSNHQNSIAVDLLLENHEAKLKIYGIYDGVETQSEIGIIFSRDGVSRLLDMANKFQKDMAELENLSRDKQLKPK